MCSRMKGFQSLNTLTKTLFDYINNRKKDSIILLFLKY